MIANSTQFLCFAIAHDHTKIALSCLQVSEALEDQITNIGETMQNADTYAFKYMDKNGESIVFTMNSVRPLTMLDIQKSIGGSNSQFNLEISGALIDKSKDAIFIEKNKNIVASMSIAFHNKPKIYCLVPNGWLPPVFISTAIFIVDRNVVSILSKNSNTTKHLDYKSTSWWLSMCEKLTFNPIFYAMEGNNKKTPTYEDFIKEFIKSSKIIKNKLPLSSIINYSSIHYESAYNLVKDLTERTNKEISFLVKVSPLITNRSSDVTLNTTRNKILSTADSLELSRQSLVLVTVLSCLYENKDGSGLLIGRDIIKPKKNYTEEDAYNAISDLRAIELFAASLCLNSDRNTSLMTCDKALASLWCGLNFDNFGFKDKAPKFDFTLSEDLFPRLNRNLLSELVLELK